MPDPTQQESAAAALKLKETKEYNLTRYNRYYAVATEFLNGNLCHTVEVATMHEDLKHCEIPRAWGAAIHNAAHRGVMRPTLKNEMEALVKYIVFSMWHTTERDCSQPWFFQNMENFFIACIDSILLLNDNDRTTKINYAKLCRAFQMVFDLADGAKEYMGLDNLDSGAHALLVACGVSPHPCFIRNGTCQMGGHGRGLDDHQFHRNLTLAHVVFMDEMAKRIMQSKNHAVETWDAAFGYYAGSFAWRGFASRARLYQTNAGYYNNILILNREVDHNFLKARMRLMDADGGHRKRVRAASPAPMKKRMRKSPPARGVTSDDGCVSPNGTLNLERIADIGQALLSMEKDSEIAREAAYNNNNDDKQEDKEDEEDEDLPFPTFLSESHHHHREQYASPVSGSPSPRPTPEEAPSTPPPHSQTPVSLVMFHSSPPHKSATSKKASRIVDMSADGTARQATYKRLLFLVEPESVAQK